MKPGDRLAVYGHLRRGERAWDAFHLEKHCRFVAPCTVAGRLHDMGDYPAIVPGEGIVKGDLLEIVSTEIVAKLDAYEDYDPADEANSQYIRKILPLIDPPGEAWVYCWNRPLRDAPLVTDGDWMAHLRGKGLL